ncbi:hypothetical protein EDC01DRAFT_743087 [Geopyxis carbonaria]|nr:hypothetical protein EDC01DRAFT_743087 [Geopyxis carbonaria]
MYILNALWGLTLFRPPQPPHPVASQLTISPSPPLNLLAVPSSSSVPTPPSPISALTWDAARGPLPPSSQHNLIEQTSSSTFTVFCNTSLTSPTLASLGVVYGQITRLADADSDALCGTTDGGSCRVLAATRVAQGSQVYMCSLDGVEAWAVKCGDAAKAVLRIANRCSWGGRAEGVYRFTDEMVVRVGGRWVDVEESGRG